MKLSSGLAAFGLAFVAAIANAVFIAAQKSVPPAANPFYFLLVSLSVSIAIWLVLALFFPHPPVWVYIRQNMGWLSIGGVGFATLSVCFYLLFNRFGASYYTLYAVMAILTTSVFTSIVFFGERYNLYTFLSIGSALLSIFFFYLSKK